MLAILTVSPQKVDPGTDGRRGTPLTGAVTRPRRNSGRPAAHRNGSRIADPLSAFRTVPPLLATTCQGTGEHYDALNREPQAQRATHLGRDALALHDTLGGFRVPRRDASPTQPIRRGGWSLTSGPCDTLGGKELVSARHTRGKSSPRCDILGGKRLAWCDTLGGLLAQIHDTLGGRGQFSTTHSGGKWLASVSCTRPLLPLDDESSFFSLLLHYNTSSINRRPARHATLWAPETPWCANPGGTT